MFGGSQPTPYDLRFAMFGIPVRVHPMFWLISAVFGWDFFRSGGLLLLTIWIACVFVSILIHELGHALTATAFGYYPHIVLHGFGGYASYTPDSRYTHFKSILITLAGPCAGFMVVGIVLLTELLLAFQNITVSPVANQILSILFIINLWWGLLNLLPVQPLDGGQITREVCMWISRSNGFRVACWIGVIVGAAVGVWGLMGGQIYLGILFLMLAWENYQNANRYGSGYYY